MVKRLSRILAVLAVALVAICMTALPAFAWSSSSNGGYKLTADDGALFAGTELVGDLIGDEQSEWDYERSINELAWLASDLDGCRRTTSIYDIYLADMETGERIDLTAPENAALANTQVTLETHVGNELELDIDFAALVRYDEATNSCTKPAYTVKTEKGRIEIGEQTYNNVTIYYFVLTGKLADLMGTYDNLGAVADDAPYSDVVSWEPWVEHDFWALSSAIEGEHVSFRVVSEEDGDGKNPGTYDKVDGSDQLRFDAELGFKFVAPTDDGYIPDVSYTANGVTTVLEPTDETYSFYDETTWSTRECRVYQVPPTAAPVTVTLYAHELTYTVNSNGTITFEQDYYPTASKISFNLPEGVHFLEAQKGTYDYRTAFAVANPQATETGGYDYYCWPDKSSTFTFELPVGYIIESVTLSPASAGTTEFYSNALDVKLDAPATLNIAVTPLQYSHVDIDSVTGISVAMTAEDITGIGLDAATLFVAEEKGASELEKMKDAIIVTLDGGTFSPDELVAYNVWYRYDDGTQFGGLAPYWAFWDGALVTVPLPQGWTAESTRVFQYFEEHWGDESYTSAAIRKATPSEDGTSLVIEAPNMLGRFVLTRETPAAPVTYDFTKAVVAPIATQTYQGSPVTPAVKVTFDGVTLVQGTDYVVQYINNNAVGTATVYIKGIGSYIGEKEAEFKIIHKPGWGSDAAGNWYYYDNNGDPMPNHWEKYAGDYYYFGYDGKLIITGVCYYAGNWYYIKGGKVQFTKSGWQTVNGTWYNFSGPYGAAVKNTWYKSGSSYYFVDKDGMLVVNDWIQYGGKWYHFNAKGVCDRVYP